MRVHLQSDVQPVWGLIARSTTLVSNSIRPIGKKVLESGAATQGIADGSGQLDLPNRRGSSRSSMANNLARMAPWPLTTALVKGEPSGACWSKNLRRARPAPGQGHGIIANTPPTTARSDRVVLALTVQRGALAVLLLEPAGLPTSSLLPRNIRVIFLPSRSPDLNPVENVWRCTRQNWLSNRVFDTYDSIINGKA